MPNYNNTIPGVSKPGIYVDEDGNQYTEEQHLIKKIDDLLKSIEEKLSPKDKE